MTIKEMRDRLNWTQKEFSLYFGIPKRTIENWESGQRACPDYVRQLIQYKLFKEELIMNTKITFRFTPDYDESKPNNNFPEETDYIVTDGVFEFSDYLENNNVYFSEDENCEGLYWVLEYGERTGAAYQVISVEPTDEELYW